MSWPQIYNLLVTHGSLAAAPADELEAALAAEGHGDRDVQIRIAEAEYRRTSGELKRKESDDGQNRWHFG